MLGLLHFNQDFTRRNSVASNQRFIAPPCLSEQSQPVHKWLHFADVFLKLFGDDLFDLRVTFNIKVNQEIPTTARCLNTLFA
jgi:hypothetical protein